MSSASESPYPHGGYPQVRSLPPAPGQAGTPGRQADLTDTRVPRAGQLTIRVPAGGGYQGTQGGPAGYPGAVRAEAVDTAAAAFRTPAGSPAVRGQGVRRAPRPGRGGLRPADGFSRDGYPAAPGGYPGAGYPGPTQPASRQARRGSGSGNARGFAGAPGYAGQQAAGRRRGGFGPAQGTSARPTWGPDSYRGQQPSRVPRPAARGSRGTGRAGSGFDAGPWPERVPPGLAPAQPGTRATASPPRTARACSAAAGPPGSPFPALSRSRPRFRSAGTAADGFGSPGGYPPQGTGRPGNAAYAPSGGYAPPPQPPRDQHPPYRQGMYPESAQFSGGTQFPPASKCTAVP